MKTPGKTIKSETISACEDETATLAARLAPLLRPGDIVLLEGNLGAGKTVFARALIRALCEDPTLDVPSPTFTLVQTYDTPCFVLWHFDLYRLERPEDVFELGWEEARASNSVALVEWPERLGHLRPTNALTVSLESMPDGRRKIRVSGHEMEKAASGEGAV